MAIHVEHFLYISTQGSEYAVSECFTTADIWANPAPIPLETPVSVITHNVNTMIRNHDMFG